MDYSDPAADQAVQQHLTTAQKAEEQEQHGLFTGPKPGLWSARRNFLLIRSSALVIRSVFHCEAGNALKGKISSPASLKLTLTHTSAGRTKLHPLVRRIGAPGRGNCVQ